MEYDNLLIADVDGTIRTKQGIPPEITDGFNALHQQKCATSVLTGKGLSRFVEACDTHLKTLISPRVPFGVENGGRIVNDEMNKNIKFHPLSTDEITAVLRAIEHIGLNIPFLAYFPEDVRRNAVMWGPKKESLANLYQKYGHFAAIGTGSISSLAQQITADRPAIFVLPESPELLDNLPKDINCVVNEGSIDINTQGVNKGTGLTEISDIIGLDLRKVIVAGNDQNDLPMYAKPVGIRILVGNNSALQQNIPHPYHKVSDPTSLGLFLLRLNP